MINKDSGIDESKPNEPSLEDDTTEEEWQVIDAAIEYIEDRESGRKSEEAVRDWVKKWVQVMIPADAEKVNVEKILKRLIDFLNTLEP